VRIDAGAIREIRDRLDLGEFIGGYVALQRRGRDLVGLCPFHGERSPSFVVHPDKGFFKCFGCGAAGDVVGFYQKIENVPFPEAARALAKRAGVELPEEDAGAARTRGEKERIYAANEVAVAYFHRMLVLDPAGADARAYCERRDLRAETIDAFKLGFAPNGWDGLARELQRAGVDAEIAIRAGLLKAGQRGPYDFYRGRLMIPTRATTGETIAFGGRSLDGGEPKYLNTGATPVYTKGRGLFALEIARRNVGTPRDLIVVEGYLDCVALHQAGFRNATASLGTAFTPEQAGELRKYADRIVLCFDADAAGSAATAKSADVLVDAGYDGDDVRIVRMPDGADPDSFVRERGRDAFAELVRTAIPTVQNALDREIAEIKNVSGSHAAVARTAEDVVRRLAPRAAWDKWRVYAAQRLGLAVEDLRASALFAEAATFAPRTRAAAAAVRAVEPPSVERDLLATLVDAPSLARRYADRVAGGFRDGRCGELFAFLCTHEDLRTVADVIAALAERPDLAETASGLVRSDRSRAVRFAEEADRLRHLDAIADSLAEREARRRLRELDERQSAYIMSDRPVPKEERDEYERLVEWTERERRRRLGTRP